MQRGQLMYVCPKGTLMVKDMIIPSKKVPGLSSLPRNKGARHGTREPKLERENTKKVRDKRNKRVLSYKNGSFESIDRIVDEGKREIEKEKNKRNLKLEREHHQKPLPRRYHYMFCPRQPS